MRGSGWQCHLRNLNPYVKSKRVVSDKELVVRNFCPFDGIPCSHVESCDDVVAVLFGEVPSFSCSRARGLFC